MTDAIPRHRSTDAGHDGTKSYGVCRRCASRPRRPILDAKVMRETMPEWFGQVPDWALFAWATDLAARLENLDVERREYVEDADYDVFVPQDSEENQ